MKVEIDYADIVTFERAGVTVCRVRDGVLEYYPLDTEVWRHGEHLTKENKNPKTSSW